MYFETVLNNSILTLKNLYNVNSLFNYNFKNETLYKISYLKKYSADFIGNYRLDTTYFSKNQSKYPDEALKIELKKGNYRLSFLNGSIIDSNKNLNDSIMTSRGKLIFNEKLVLMEDDKNIINEDNVNEIISRINAENIYFDFKITSQSKFYIWINDKNTTGFLDFAIHKLNIKENETKQTELIFENSSIPKLKLDINYFYELSLDELKKDEFKIPTFKYPVGTYQIVLNENISNNKEINNLIDIQSNDKQKFDIDKITNKLNSLHKINIPNDNNPLNFYFMLGKCELLVFIDFINDKYYVYPNSYVECFMNLFLPDSKLEKIEECNEFVKYKITEYKHISYDFKNKNEIINNLSKWINVDKSDIKYDDYELYFYAYNYNMNEYYMNNIVNKYIDFEKYFVYIELDIYAKIVDDVSIKIENEDTYLDYTIVDYKEDSNNQPISGGLWKVIDKKPYEFNFINWTQPKKWENTNIENKLISYINGKGYIKISKQRFKNLFNVDLNYINYGNFTDEQFKKLKLNNPLIYPYNRFQFWLSLNL